MLDQLRSLVVFAEVVEAKSFARAAARLGMTRSAVSKHVAQLEARLGVQLLSRTTRKLSLTEVGERVLAASRAVRDGAELAREAAHAQIGVVEGVLRVTAPANLGRKYLVPLARELLDTHPRLELTLLLSDSYLDLVDERIDVALRVGGFVDSSLVARRIAKVEALICAAPRYLAARGVPRLPRDLEKHEVIQHVPSTEPGRLTLTKGKRTVQVRVSGRIASNDGAAGVEAAVQGLGLVMGPEFELSDEVRRGRLVPVLVGWRTGPMALHAVCPPRRHVSSKVRTFIDFVHARWRSPPWQIAAPAEPRP